MSEQTTTTPRGFFYTVGELEISIDPDGSLTLDTHIRDAKLIKLPADRAYSLYLAFAKLPHVGALMERLEGQRQDHFFARMAAQEAEFTAHHAIVKKERDRTERAINDRYRLTGNFGIVEEARNDLLRCKAQADHWGLVGDTDRAAFWREEAASYTRELVDLLGRFPKDAIASDRALLDAPSRTKIEIAIDTLYPEPANASEADYNRVQAERTDAQAALCDRLGDEARATYWRTEAAAYRRGMEDALADQPAAE